MTDSTSTLEKLIDKIALYSKTSLELLTLNAVSKTADIFSTLAVKLILSVVVVLFVLFLSIGLSLWIGSVLGVLYYGFFIVAAGYLLLAVLLYSFRNLWIKRSVSDFIIGSILK